MPDFNMKQQVDPVAVANLIQRKSQIDQQNAHQQQEDTLNAVLGAAKAASDATAGIVEAAKNRQKKALISSLADSVASNVGASPNPTTARLFQSPPPGQIGPTPAGQPIQTASFDPTRQDMVRDAVKLNPEPFTADLAKQVFAIPKTGAPSRMQSKDVLLNGKPAVTGYNPDDNSYYEPGTKNKITGKIEPMPQASSNTSEVRKQMLIATLNDRFSKKMSPTNWSPNTLAGKSAAMVANADSAIGLADQMLNKEVPITKQNMTSLALDANRVLSQSSVASEKIVHDLQAKTGFSTIEQAAQYFSGHPKDQKLGEFVSILRTEIARQREMRQKTVDRTLAGEFASLNQLRRMSPDDWEAQVQANGFDVEAAKKGHLKIRPDVGSTMYGWDIGESTRTPGKAAAPQGATDLGNGFSYTVSQ